MNRQPTPDMLRAGMSAYLSGILGRAKTTDALVRLIFNAMRAAAKPKGAATAARKRKRA